MSSKAMYANGTILVSRFVKIDTTRNNAVLACALAGVAYGIAQEGGRVAPIPSVTTSPVEAAQAGENVKVYVEGDECLLAIGSGGVTAGGYIRSDANGAGIALAGTGQESYGAVALESAASGELCRVRVTIGKISVSA